MTLALLPNTRVKLFSLVPKRYGTKAWKTPCCQAGYSKLRLFLAPKSLKKPNFNGNNGNMHITIVFFKDSASKSNRSG